MAIRGKGKVAHKKIAFMGGRNKVRKVAKKRRQKSAGKY